MDNRGQAALEGRDPTTSPACTTEEDRREIDDTILLYWHEGWSESHITDGLMGKWFHDRREAQRRVRSVVRRSSGASRSMLLQARVEHSKRTGHADIVVGANFVECRECGRHAHIDGEPQLRVHTRGYQIDRRITAEQF